MVAEGPVNGNTPRISEACLLQQRPASAGRSGEWKRKALVGRLLAALRQAAVVERLRPLTQLGRDSPALVASEELDLDLVARRVVEDRVGDVGVLLDLDAVHLHDQVTADVDALGD